MTEDTTEELRDRAERYREMAKQLTDERVIQALQQLANDYEEMALELDRRSIKSPKSE